MKQTVKYFFVVTILVLISIAPAFSKDNKDLVKPIEVFNLPNGQQIIIKEVHTNPIVTIDTWVRTGSINEDDKNNGVAHFLEHLLFKGTKNHPTGEIDQILESKGSVFNAATSKDYTHFYITTASEYLDTAIELHADMLLNAAIPPEELAKERNVVIEEIRRSNDNPERQVYYALNGLFFKKHPYKYDTLGTTDIIRNIPREKIMDFYNKWYVPSNMTTVIVGDVDTQEVLKLIKKYFGTDKKERMPLPVYSAEPGLTKTQEEIAKGDYKQSYFEMGFRVPSLSEAEKTYALDVASIVLGKGRASRLYKRLKQDHNLVNSLFVSNFPMKDNGIFVFDFTLQPENVDKVEKIVLEEIDKMRTTLITNEELSRAKNQVQRDFIYGNESVGDVARSIGYNVTVGTLDEYIHYVEKINSVTREDVLEASKKFLNPDYMAVSLLEPEEKAKKVESKAVQKEAVQPVKDKKAEKVKDSDEVYKTVLPNGITLLLKSNSANDVVSMNVYIKGGKLLQDKPGLADLTSNLLVKGTQSRTEEDIARETEALGIEIDSSAMDDYFQISIRSTRADFPEAFMVLTDILKNATFEQSQIDKVKQSMINAIKAVEDSPMSYSLVELYMNTFGDHPYGQVGEKVAAELPDITRQEVVDFYHKYFVPENMVISVVGNIPRDVVERYIEQSWSNDATKKDLNSESLSGNAEPLKENKIVKIPKETEAAWISMGWLAPNLEAKDYAAMKVINALLGGGLSARLTKHLREEKGLAYDIGSFFPSRNDNSIFVLYIGTEPKNINTVVKGFQSEIDKLKTDLVPVDELNDAKQKITGKYALSHETNSQQAFYIGWFETSGMGYKFDNKYPELINEVTPEDIKETANKVFSKPYVLSIVAPEEAIEKFEE